MSRKISSLKTFYGYLEKYHGWSNLAAELTFPKLEKRLPSYLSEEEIKNLMDENKALMDKIGENQKKLSKAKSTLKKKKGDYNVIRKKVNNLDGK